MENNVINCSYVSFLSYYAIKIWKVKRFFFSSENILFIEKKDKSNIESGGRIKKNMY